jgi:hypothetical protein
MLMEENKFEYFCFETMEGLCAVQSVTCLNVLYSLLHVRMCSTACYLSECAVQSVTCLNVQYSLLHVWMCCTVCYMPECAVQSVKCLKMRSAREDDGEPQAACAGLCRGYCLHTVRNRTYSPNKKRYSYETLFAVNSSIFQLELQNHPAITRDMLLSALQKWEQLCL